MQVHQENPNFPCRRRPARKRRGLSLLEVILSIGILAMSLVAISELVTTGFRSASMSRLLSEAQMLCDTKMAEVAAGVLPLEAVAGASIEENENWQYDVEINQGDIPGLLVVIVTVREASSSDPVEFYVTRFLPDPDFDPAAE